MNQIVKYHNELNNIALKNFSKADYDLFMVLCAEMKEKGTTEREFSYTELRKQAAFKKSNSNAEMFSELNKVSENLAKTTCAIQHNGMKRVIFTLFTKFENDGENGTLKVRVNDEFQFLLNELASNFTRFELKEFVELDSKYAKTLYRLLKQFRTTGDLTISAEDFREKIDIPKSYSNKIIISRIIKPAVEALKEVIPGLDYQIIRASKRGAPVKAYRFSFTPEAPDRQLTIADWQNSKKKTGAKKKSGNKFNDMIQHEDYDMASIEEALLNGGAADPEE